MKVSFFSDTPIQIMSPYPLLMKSLDTHKLVTPIIAIRVERIAANGLVMLATRLILFLLSTAQVEEYLGALHPFFGSVRLELGLEVKPILARPLSLGLIPRTTISSLPSGSMVEDQGRSDSNGTAIGIWIADFT